jgi:hypothetical protein
VIGVDFMNNIVIPFGIGLAVALFFFALAVAVYTLAGVAILVVGIPTLAWVIKKVDTALGLDR